MARESVLERIGLWVVMSYLSLVNGIFTTLIRPGLMFYENCHYTHAV